MWRADRTVFPWRGDGEASIVSKLSCWCHKDSKVNFSSGNSGDGGAGVDKVGERKEVRTSSLGPNRDVLGSSLLRSRQRGLGRGRL